MRRWMGWMVMVGALGLAPVTQAQQPMGPAAPAADSTANVQTELQSIQERLAKAEGEAMKDPQIQAARDALQKAVEEKMKAIEPDFDKHIERMEALQTELAAAQQGGDQERFQKLVVEAQALQSTLQAAQAQAIEDGTVTKRIEDLQARVLKKMNEVEPETDQLIARAETLVAKLRAGGAPGGPPMMR